MLLLDAGGGFFQLLSLLLAAPSFCLPPSTGYLTAFCKESIHALSFCVLQTQLSLVRHASVAADIISFAP